MWWLWVGIFALVALLMYVAMHAFSTSSGAPVAKADQDIQVDGGGWQEPTPAPGKPRKSSAPVPAPTVTLQGYQKSVPGVKVTVTTIKTPVPADPRFRTCGLANLAGYGNYHVGRIEYGWYIDRDHDGIACEFTIKVVPSPVPTTPAPSKTIKPKPRPRVTVKITVTVTAPAPTSTSPTPEPTETGDPPDETEPPASPTASKIIPPEPTETITPEPSPSGGE